MPILMSYWSDDTSRYANDPLPGSVDASGAPQSNPTLLGSLDAIDVLAYRSLTPAYGLDIKGMGPYRLAQQLLARGFVSHETVIDGAVSAVHAYSASTHEWMSYESPRSVAAKAHYVIRRHLAGMMMWEIGEDLPLSDRRSLLRSARAALSRKP